MALPRDLANLVPNLTRSGSNVGVNTTSPQSTLSVNGTLSMGNTSSYWITTHNTAPTFYISPTGNDTTGDGSNGSPWLTLNRALQAIGKLLPNSYLSATIVMKNGSYTLSSIQYFRGFTGGGTISINAETAGSVTVGMNGNQFQFERNSCAFQFSGITFNSPSTPSMFRITDTFKVRFESNCAINNLVSGGSPGNFNECISVGDSGLEMLCPLTVTNEASYGAVINIYGGSTVYFSGTISKSGSRHSNAAVSVQGTSNVTFQNTINNFNFGINMGQSHYDAEYGGYALANSLSLTNCNVGIRLSNNGTFKPYAITSTSGTTTPVYWLNGWYGGQYGSEYVYVGYNTSVSSSYRLQVNSQIYATNATIATSDGRYKKNVESINGGLDAVMKLRPVHFDWIPHKIHNFDVENNTSGFIAQEVKEALADKPYVNSIIKRHEMVVEDEQYEMVEIEPGTPEVFDDNGSLIAPAKPPVTEKRIIKPAVMEDFYGMSETGLIPVLTKAIQELKAELDTVKAELAALKQV